MAIIVAIHGLTLSRREDEANSGGVTPPPRSVKALAGFIVVLGLILIGLAAWKIGKWRRSKTRAASQQFAGLAAGSDSVVHVDFSSKASEAAASTKEDVYQEPYKWRPISRPPTAHPSNKAVKKGTKRFLGPFVPKKPSPLSIDAHSPPPTYAEAAPLSPPTIVIESASSTTVTLPTVTVEMLKTDPSPTSPLPSPRTKSIGPDSPLHKSLSSAATAMIKGNRLSMSAKQLPRLMVVVNTFAPTLADELAVTVGEPIKLIQEYEDEWCLVQRVGKSDSERGVIPRFCIQDIPILNKGASNIPSTHGRQ